MASQEIFSLLYEIIDRLERIEKQLDLDLDALPDNIDETFNYTAEEYILNHLIRVTNYLCFLKFNLNRMLILLRR